MKSSTECLAVSYPAVFYFLKAVLCQGGCSLFALPHGHWSWYKEGALETGGSWVILSPEWVTAKAVLARD